MIGLGTFIACSLVCETVEVPVPYSSAFQASIRSYRAVVPSVAIFFDWLIIFLVVSPDYSSKFDVLLIRRWGESGVIYGQSFWSMLPRGRFPCSRNNF